MTYEELKKAYEMAMQKCSELESEKAELEKKNSDLKREREDKDLRIEHLTELVLKRNKMLFGQKSEKGKFICDGQLAFEGCSTKPRQNPILLNLSRPPKL